MTMNMSTPPADLTPKHVRAARALLAWSQQDLAKKASVATSTVADFERGSRTPVANNAQAIRNALESAGIQFLSTGAVIGPPIPRIAAPESLGAPLRWVNAEDLANWANRMEGAASLPTLMANLIHATHGSAIRLRFPSDEGILHAGWDGYSSTDRASTYVPQGETGWEIGTQRRDIAGKATDDFSKRTQTPEPLDPANATYIFVTPRHWPKKDEWAKARRAEGAWRDVRVYDADDLVHWIERTPTVGLWIATRLGKRPPGTRQLEEIWEEWSLATQWPLTEELVLSDRDEDAAQILRWLRSEPSVFSIQATTTDEAVAFFHATLNMLPDEAAVHYRARCLVTTETVAARALANSPAPQIIVLTEPDPGLARSLTERGHFVLQTYDDRPISRGDIRKLTRPSRDGIADALIDTGIPESRAQALARDSARNLGILRRLIPSAPGRLPAWAQTPPPRALLAALLTGGWDDGSESDKATVSELAGQPYEQVTAELIPYVGEFDSPLRKVGSTWRIASPSDAWVLLAPYLTAGELERFEAAAQTVLGSVDPRFDLVPDERWRAPIHSVNPQYSELLRHGVGEVLILLALWGDKIQTVPDARRRADNIVSRLLRNADKRRWWSLSRDFRLLAEASPGAFLGAIEDSLDQNDPTIRVLFGTEENGLFGAEYLSDLLWALESLAWSPDLLPRVTLALARLDAIDNSPGRHMNRPANSLKQIHLLWLPQTYASLDQRLRALDLVRKHERNAAWKLMLGILPHGQDTSMHSPLPRWRDFSIDNVEPVTWSLIGRGAAAISERLLADVNLDVVRWQLLLDRLGDLAPNREAVLAALETAEPKIKDEPDRMAIWARLRQLLHHHRQVPDADWAMSSEDLDRLDLIYDRFTPTDATKQLAWLFEPPVQLPKPSHEGWESDERDVDEARRRAALDVFSSRGVTGVLDLARQVTAAAYIGKALFDAGVSETDLAHVIEAAVQSNDLRERELARGLIISIFGNRGEAWADALIAKAHEQKWGDTAVLTILSALPISRWTWDQAALAGESIETAYWSDVPIFWIDNVGDAMFAVQKLIVVGRARDALPLAARSRKIELPSDLLVEVLRQAVRQPFKGETDTNGSTMFQHHVAEILNRLDARSDVDKDTLAGLEWTYLPVLEHSRRPVKVLLDALCRHPSLFIEMVSAIYKPSEDSGVADLEPTDPVQARAIAHQAYRLLELWDQIPGALENGSIDGAALEVWIKEARNRAKTAGREDVADDRIGKMLSASPVGNDGVWPAEAVRDAIDLFRSKPMFEGFWVGKINRRGVTTRLPRAGGTLEREEATKYRNWSAVLAYSHPHTARALDTLAESYERDAQRNDDATERLDW